MNIKKVILNSFVYGLYSKYAKRRINFYRTNYDKNVLISYIVDPFTKGVNNQHTNTMEVVAIADIFNELSYNVDVYNYDYKYNIDYSKYDIIFGFGRPIENSFYKFNGKSKRVFYGTGLNHIYNNYFSLNRVMSVYKTKKKFLLESARIAHETWPMQLMISDEMILLGNDYVRETYEKFYNKRIHMINVSSYKFFERVEITKDLGKAKKNFLWFGSSGLIHKGLDLLLDIFSARDDINLFICGNIDKEQGFMDCYYNELYNTPNIHTVGFIDLKSNKFKELIEMCAFVIVPSCAEANCTSVINCMRHGLIPVITPGCGIDIEDFGIEISDTTKECVEKAIEYSISLECDKLELMEQKCLKTTEERYNLDKFKMDLKIILENIINTH